MPEAHILVNFTIRLLADHRRSTALKFVSHLLQQLFVPAAARGSRLINSLCNRFKDMLKPIVYAMQICTGSIYVQIVRRALCFLASIA